MKPYGIAIIVLSFSLLLQSCGTAIKKDGPPLSSVDMSKVREPTPRYEPKSRYGNPKSYVALGKRYYVLQTARGYDQRGIASWYGRKFNGQLTSTREPYDMLSMSAASPVLPIPCYVRVTNLENGRTAIVRVNDRGPFAPNRIIDLSYVAAKKLGYARKGTALVEVKAIDPRHPNTTPPTILTANPHLYLQVGAFSNEEHAYSLKNRLEKYTSKPIRISQTFSHQRKLYRVRIGPLNNVDESDALFNNLNHHGIHSAITVIS